ncbi:MAG: metallopeptidase, partial [Clostridia bacterium]|nr:metallopeptidase [Clostridia bacterium]
MRFLDMALSKFTFCPAEEGTISTDGELLTYNPKYVLSKFKQNKQAVVRDYLHLVLHCVYRHMFVSTLVDAPLWDLACDVAIENTINELGISGVETG